MKRYFQTLFAAIGSAAVSEASLNDLRNKIPHNDRVTDNYSHPLGSAKNRELQTAELQITGTYPLEACQGDCKDDSDCKAGLVCYYRFQQETVPGCTGIGGWNKYYCADRPDTYLFWVTETADPGQLGLCEGSCTADIDCADGLICYFRSNWDSVPGCDGNGRKDSDYCIPDPANVPTKSPTPGPTDLPTKVPTPMPTDIPTTQPIKSPIDHPTKAPADPPTFEPTRNPTNQPRTAPPTKSPTMQPTNPPVQASTELVIIGKDRLPSEAYPLEACQGDCKYDSDCKGELVCYHRYQEESVPGCTGTGVWREDYCADRPDNYLFMVSDAAEPGQLKLCEGSCRSDIDCADGLICHFRSNWDSVPGCNGEGRRGSDYCKRDPNSGPAKSPTPEPTKIPTTENYYQYENMGTKCFFGGEDNWQGPAPFADKSNVAIQFFAFGDTPYDNSCSTCNTCIGEDGVTKQADCTRFDCILLHTTMSELPADNTCTYEGPDYDCVRDSIIPYMNSRMDNGAAFIAHAGDILKGSGVSANRRCNEYSFASRKDLFSSASNFLIVPGDNDWNECYGYDINANTDPIREMWRANFADSNSPFNQFSTDFPASVGGGRPMIQRKANNPEIFYFAHNDIAFFGLNRPARSSYISDKAPVDLNAEWVEDRLSLDNVTCKLKSIVIIAQALVKDVVYNKVEEYFAACGSTLPVLTITGDLHPQNYCMAKDSTNTRLDLMVEAFRSGPLMVSVVRDYNGGGDFFHVDDSDLAETNAKCPTFV